MAISRRTKIGGAIGGAVLAAAATVTMLLTGPSVTNIAPGGDLQAAINAAQPGDTLVLQADVSYTCPGGCVLPNKTGAEFITIKSSRYEEIPVRTFFSTVPTVEVTKLLARVSPSFSTEPAFRAAPGAHHYKLLGLNVTAPTGQATRLIELGVSGAAQDTPEEIPHHFVLDKNWVHGGATQEVQRCVALNSDFNEITNNWITDCHGRGYDSQAIAGWNGGSNTQIINNSLSGAGENYMSGGSPASVPNLVPTNIEFRRNYVWKPLSWYERDPSYAGVKWTVKNLFELKNARNVIVDGNVFEGNWTDAQTGRAVQLTPRPSDSGLWATIEDVQFTNNIIRNTAAGINVLGADEKGSDPNRPIPTETRLRRVRIANNLWEIDGAKYVGDGVFLLITNKTEDVTVENNTVFHNGNVVSTDYAPNTRFIYRNNLSRHNTYGIFGGGLSTGNVSIAHYFPGAIVTGNIMTKEGGAPSNVESVYPAGNFFPVTMAAVGFVDLANKNLRLSASSPYKGKGSNGLDPGADINALEAAIGGTGPTPTPFPSVSPTATATATIAPTPSATPTLPPSPSPSPTATSTPSTTSPDGTKAVTFTDATGGVWTIGPEKQTLRNGVHMGGGFGSIYKWLGGTVYVLGTNNWWYKFTGTAWQSVSQLEPGTQPTTRVVPWPKQPGQQNSLLDQQWTAGRYRLKRVDGNSATFELVVN